MTLPLLVSIFFLQYILSLRESVHLDDALALEIVLVSKEVSVRRGLTIVSTKSSFTLIAQFLCGLPH